MMVVVGGGRNSGAVRADYEVARGAGRNKGKGKGGKRKVNRKEALNESSDDGTKKEQMLC